MTTNTGARPYGILFTAGPDPESLPIADTSVDVLAASLDADSFLSVFLNSSISAGDTTAKGVFAPSSDPHQAVLTYAAIVGFTSRFCDVAYGPDQIDYLSAVLASARKLTRAVEAKVRRDDEELMREFGVIVQSENGPYNSDSEAVVTYHLDEYGLPTVSPIDAARIRFACPVIMVVPDSTPEALRLFASICGWRSTPRRPFRMPLLAASDSEFTTSPEEIWSATRELRIRRFTAAPEEIADPSEPDIPQLLVSIARDTDIAEVVQTLGSTFDRETERWYCPRISRHRTVEPIPTIEMDLGRNRARCSVCDHAWLDPVSFVMRTLGVSPTEAAAICGVTINHLGG